MHAINAHQDLHDRDFRVRAVRKIIENGADLQQVASDLGVIPRLLSSWLRRYAVDSETEGGAWRLKTNAERAQELRRDLDHLKQELDRLKQITSVSRGFLRQPRDIQQFPQELRIEANASRGNSRAHQSPT